MLKETNESELDPEEWELECTDPETGCQLYLSKTQKGKFMLRASREISEGELNIIFRKKFKDYIANVVAKRS